MKILIQHPCGKKVRIELGLLSHNPFCPSCKHPVVISENFRKLITRFESDRAFAEFIASRNGSNLKAWLPRLSKEEIHAAVTAVHSLLARPIEPGDDADNLHGLTQYGATRDLQIQTDDQISSEIESELSRVVERVERIENSIAALAIDFGFQGLEPTRFEELVLRVFETFGFIGELTPVTGVEGIDILLVDPTGEAAVVQCKRYAESHSIAPQDVRALLGSMVHANASYAYFVTTSKFSIQSVRFCEGKPIFLIDRSRFRRLLLFALALDLEQVPKTVTKPDPVSLVSKLLAPLLLSVPQNPSDPSRPQGMGYNASEDQNA
jgi:hypothetical protein